MNVLEMSIVSYIKPLVEELITLWHGKELKIYGFNSKQVVRCALLSVACDLPAGRKLCGFLNFNAHFGCTRCWKEFPGEVGNQDFSGFDREKWKSRTEKEHREIAASLTSCNTKTERAAIESATGYRYTALLELPYFNPTRMLILDPMHNLFLGTAKHFVKSVWLNHGVLSSGDYNSIQSIIDEVLVPSDLGRIPHKIASGFSSFTADQFKNWVLYYSPLALRDKLIDSHYECWRHFVLACRLLCSKVITLEHAKLADALLMYFCKRTERLYGKDVITPNMHFHTHLHECVLDYGPLHGFWLFSFERFNGILGQQPNNNRSIEIQLMKRFLRDNVQLSMPLPDDFSDEFLPVFTSRKIVGTVSDSTNPTLLTENAPTLEAIEQWSLESGEIDVHFPSCSTRGVLNVSEKRNLAELYSRLYSVQSSLIDVPSSYIKYREVTLNGKTIGSFHSRSKNSSIVMCSWKPFLASSYEHTQIVEQESEQRPARIDYFMKHTVRIESKTFTHVLFSASWFKSHPKRNSFGPPISVWECDIFDLSLLSSIIPIQFISSRTVSLVDTLDDSFGKAIFVIPCIDF